MGMHAIRRLIAVAAVAALSVPLGLTSSGAAAQQPAGAVKSAAAAPLPGAYISPWGSAQVTIGDETLAWMEREGIALEAISPFVMDADGRGFSMPIGSTAGDGLDAKGRIFYPGGLRIRHQASGKSITLQSTFIRVMPTPAYSAGVSIDGEKLREEVVIAESTYVEVMAGARPSPTGFRIKKAPFYVTQEAADLLAAATGATAPRAGSLFGTLTPNFDYVPGAATPPSFPTFP
ncbi:hypothetical protein N7925_02720 [Streptomyces sp. CA-278952]|uniref:hypothetical protein n=1 Tax=Streptomyces sp. CA-278952 TaxID=2980556 RepID=UPI002367B783|nr:hypothetical protein [Streptomyces sp. CA-278952]WDG27323.1 hypothetical protein N7925_02720 [Streptomyces sp. CA-278952]